LLGRASVFDQPALEAATVVAEVAWEAADEEEAHGDEVRDAGNRQDGNGRDQGSVLPFVTRLNFGINDHIYCDQGLHQHGQIKCQTNVEKPFSAPS